MFLVRLLLLVFSVGIVEMRPRVGVKIVGTTLGPGFKIKVGSAASNCPPDYFWPFENGTKCCATFANANKPNKYLDFYDPLEDCFNGDYITCPGMKWNPCIAKMNGKAVKPSTHHCPSPATYGGCCFTRVTLNLPKVNPACNGSAWGSEALPDACCPSGQLTVIQDCKGPPKVSNCIGTAFKPVPSKDTWTVTSTPHWTSPSHHLAIYAIDGILHTGYNIFHASTSDLKNWLQIEFPVAAHVLKIIYYTRPDYHSRIHDIQFRVGMEKTTGGLQTITKNTICGTTPSTTSSEETYHIECPSPLLGKYITVQQVAAPGDLWDISEIDVE